MVMTAKREPQHKQDVRRFELYRVPPRVVAFFLSWKSRQFQYHLIYESFVLLMLFQGLAAQNSATVERHEFIISNFHTESGITLPRPASSTGPTAI